MRLRAINILDVLPFSHSFSHSLSAAMSTTAMTLWCSVRIHISKQLKFSRCVIDNIIYVLKKNHPKSMDRLFRLSAGNGNHSQHLLLFSFFLIHRWFTLFMITVKPIDSYWNDNKILGWKTCANAQLIPYWQLLWQYRVCVRARARNAIIHQLRFDHNK